MDGSRLLAGEEAKWSSRIGPARQLDGPSGQVGATRNGIAARKMGSQRAVRRCGTVRCGAVRHGTLGCASVYTRYIRNCHGNARRLHKLMVGSRKILLTYDMGYTDCRKRGKRRERLRTFAS